MVEPTMFFGLGFLAACLIALIIVPLVHARAVRLTTRRVQASAPISMTEIQADKDQLRAEFAMSTRRLEMSVEQLKGKTSSQLADLGKKTEAVARLKADLNERAVALAALETRDKVLLDRVRMFEEELGLKSNALQDTERKLAEREAELAKIGQDLGGRTATVDGQRIEIIALKTQLATLRDQATDLDKEFKQTQARLAHQQAEAETGARELAEERSKAQSLATRLSQAERQLESETTRATALARRMTELEGQLAKQGAQLADASRERDLTRLDLDTARRLEKELRDELATIDRRHEASTESLRSDRALLEGQLERAREERTKLQREVATLKRQTESAWAAERMENALLRERINDVSAEVAQLTAALEGPDSPIETILAEDAPSMSVHHNGIHNGTQNVSAPLNLPRSNGSLADRIRALQSRSSRISSAT